jgi:hypothetical protein
MAAEKKTGATTMKKYCFYQCALFHCDSTGVKSHLDHEPRHRVRVLLAREYAKGVSNDLHRSPHNHGAEIPGAMAQE